MLFSGVIAPNSVLRIVCPLLLDKVAGSAMAPKYFLPLAFILASKRPKTAVGAKIMARIEIDFIVEMPEVVSRLWRRN